MVPNYGARLAAGVGAAFVVIGFFLPWLDGTAEFAARDFSGFDFARLIRNFEITAESQSEAGQIRATALLIYLMPALVVNSAILRLVRRAVGIPATVVAYSSVVAGGYGLVLLSALVFLSVVEVNEFAVVVGAPQYGFLITALGCAVLLGAGLARLPYRRAARS